LALGMAFLVNTKPDELKELDPGIIILKQVSVITAHGRLVGEAPCRIWQE
jgi:hypothetical protein